MKIVINDYCGHPFQFDLSKELVSRGFEVCHILTSASGGPKADFYYYEDRLQIFDIDMANVEKQNFVKRWFQETEYGYKVVEKLQNWKPDIIVSANTPLAAQRIIQYYSLNNDIKFIHWLQDLISIAAKKILKKKMGIFGTAIGIVFGKIEKNILKKSNHIITIAEDFNDVISKWGVTDKQITTIPNWAPIDQIPILNKSNSFADRYFLKEKFVILYSGTLGMKHNPGIIVSAAENLKENGDIVFMVATDGIGMDYLRSEIEKKKIKNIKLLPLQPFDVFPEMLASADVLLVLLETDAGIFSVPSKVWSGYCAARPSILVVPKENLAAKITERINAGIVIPNDETDNLKSVILELKDNTKLCQTMGQNAREYAEANFPISVIADKFINIFSTFN